MSFRCMIVDDEPNAVELLSLFIEQATDWVLVGKCYNGLEALNLLRRCDVDVIFLDVNMPELNGIELASLLPKVIKIVFTTAYADHGAASYAFNTIDYLLKPVTLQRFLIAKHKLEIKAKPEDRGIATMDEEYLFVKSGKTLQKILLKEVTYFEGEKEYVRLVSMDSEILVYRRLKEIEAQLEYPFIRVHNSFIVNIKCIDKIQDNHIHIGSKRIPVSEKFRNDFLKVVRQRTF